MQLAVSFKIDPDFESVLKGVQRDDRDSNASQTKKYQKHITWSFAYKVECIDDRFSKPVVFYRGKKCIVSKFIKAVLKEYRYSKGLVKKQFNKNFVMTEDDEKGFKSSNKCWICGGNNKVREDD